jgi:hypothetical protein
VALSRSTVCAVHLVLAGPVLAGPVLADPGLAADDAAVVAVLEQPEAQASASSASAADLVNAFRVLTGSPPPQPRLFAGIDAGTRRPVGIDPGRSRRARPDPGSSPGRLRPAS